MDINQNVSLNAQITVKDAEGNDTTVMNLNSNFDIVNMNFSLNVSTQDKSLITSVNASSISSQYTDFFNAVTNKGKELGFPLF